MEMTELNERLVRCQMTMSKCSLVNESYFKCGKPAKYRVPVVEMHVEYVCGIHAKSLDKLYERTGQSIRCILLSGSN